MSMTARRDRRPGSQAAPGDARRHLSTRIVVAAPLALICTVLSLMSARPEFAILGVGPLLVTVWSVARTTPPIPAVDVDVRPGRVVEHDEATLMIRIAGLAPGGDVDVTLVAPDAIETDIADVFSCSAGAEPVEVAVRLRCRRWGLHRVGVGRITVTDGAFGVTRRVDALAGLIVLPEPERLRAMVAPRRPPQVTGRHPSPARGPGLEFADLRPFQPGDRPRDINWRATARRGDINWRATARRGDVAGVAPPAPAGQVWVNDRHPDRGGDVILLLDSVDDPGGTTAATLDAAVRAAASVAEVVLRARDRIGFVGLGGRLRWLVPGGGLRQWYRLAETLIGERPTVLSPGAGDHSGAIALEGNDGYGRWLVPTASAAAVQGVMHRNRWLRTLPRAALPPDGIVVVLSPLLHGAVVDVVVDLRARGTDVLLVEVDPADHVTVPDDLAWDVARRLWDLERAAMRRHLAATGITVVRWSPHEAFGEAVSDAVRLRRRSAGRGIGRPARLG